MIGHMWYNVLDSAVSRLAKEGTVRFLGFKMLGECALLHPISLVIYFTCIGVGNGDTIREVREQLARDFWPTLACEYVMWCPVDLCNFWVVPVRPLITVRHHELRAWLRSGPPPASGEQPLHAGRKYSAVMDQGARLCGAMAMRNSA